MHSTSNLLLEIIQVLTSYHRLSDSFSSNPITIIVIISDPVDLESPPSNQSDLKAYAKWNTWQSLRGTTKQEAMKKYINKVEQVNQLKKAKLQGPTDIRPLITIPLTITMEITTTLEPGLPW